MLSLHRVYLQVSTRLGSSCPPSLVFWSSFMELLQSTVLTINQRKYLTHRLFSETAQFSLNCISLFSLEVCENPEWTFKMCPLCDESLGCAYWDLKISCGSGKVRQKHTSFASRASYLDELILLVLSLLGCLHV